MMHHAITLGGLLAMLGVGVGVLLILGGVLAFFAGMMSDATGEGDATGRNGLIAAGAGLVLVAGSIWLVLS